jgi:hypothetical protein
VNETDCSGQLFASKVAEIFLSGVFGMVAQLFDDMVIYILQVMLHGKNKASFNPDAGDYIERALEWALNCVNPFSGKKKILNIILQIVPVVVRQIWDWIQSKAFDLFAFLKNILLALLGTIMDCVMGWATKLKISQIKKNFRGRKKAFKAEKVRIKAKYKVLGQNISTGIDIATTVIDTIVQIVFA